MVCRMTSLSMTFILLLLNRLMTPKIYSCWSVILYYMHIVGYLVSSITDQRYTTFVIIFTKTSILHVWQAFVFVSATHLRLGVYPPPHRREECLHHYHPHPRHCVQDLVAKIQDQYLDFHHFPLVLSVMHLIHSRNLTRSTDMYDKVKKQHQ